MNTNRKMLRHNMIHVRLEKEVLLRSHSVGDLRYGRTNIPRSFVYGVARIVLNRSYSKLPCLDTSGLVTPRSTNSFANHPTLVKLKQRIGAQDFLMHAV